MFLNKYRNYFLGLLRIISGYAFVLHATAKFWEFPMSMTSGKGSVELTSLMGIGGVIELVFGILLTLGLFTRVSAFLLSGQMAVAYFMFHAPKGFFFPLMNGGEPAILYCFIFLYFVFAGAGAFALDNKIAKK
ncbi:DoxX family protein [Aggregatibacter aphrophilus]|jgi:phosphoribosylaminoimidazolecarboxamide formyltransferase/IMP cyclohydrolase|uniref:DoxX family protein n=1 Tax=Aggregatibacter aphrophilus TaxID=732 RepID=UPI000D65448D|nr:DoxX family protein [Aggregatibacter aphrophilus]